MGTSADGFDREAGAALVPGPPEVSAPHRGDAPETAREPRDVIAAHEVATLLCVNRKTFYDAANRGQLRHAASGAAFFSVGALC